MMNNNALKRFAMCSMVLAMLSLTACQNMPQQQPNKELIGGASGALIGGILGSKVGKGSGQLWATGAGVLLGALAGSEIGKSLDKADLAYAQQANQRAYTAPVGETISWNNPDSGNYGTVTPTRDGYSASGRYCREYTQTIYVGGQQQQAVGKACQLPDGTWQIMN